MSWGLRGAVQKGGGKFPAALFFGQVRNQLDVVDRQRELELVFQPGFLQHIRHMEFDR